MADIKSFIKTIKGIELNKKGRVTKLMGASKARDLKG